MNREDFILKAAGNLISHNDDLIEERESTRKWILEVASLLNISPHTDGTGTVCEEWAKLRMKISEKLAGED